MRFLLPLLLCSPAVAQLQDVGFDDFTPPGDPDLIIVREVAYGANGVNLTPWGMPGVHDYVQSIYVRARQTAATAHALRGRLIFPPGATVLGVLTSASHLGGSADDGILTGTDAVFAIADPDLYSAPNRGLGTVPSEHACVRANGTVDFHLTFTANTDDLDDFRVIVDYGSSFPADVAFDVETFVNPGAIEAESGERGLRVGGGGVLGSGDWGEVLGLDGIPITSAAEPSANAGHAYDMTSGIMILRGEALDLYDPSEEFFAERLMRGSNGWLSRGPYGYLYSKRTNFAGYVFTDVMSGAQGRVLVAGVAPPLTVAANESGREVVLARPQAGATSPIEVSIVDVDSGELIATHTTVTGDMTSLSVAHVAAGKIFLLGTYDDLLVMDPVTGAYARHVLSSVAGSYRYIESNAAETELYLLRAASASTVVDVFDIATGTVTYSALATTDLPEPRGITRDAAGNVWIINRNWLGSTLSLAAYDPATWTEVASLPRTCGLPSASYAARADVHPAPLGGPRFCSPAVTNATGYPGTIAALGSLEAAQNDLHLLAYDLPNNQFGYFLNSQTTGVIPHPGGSNGNLCVTGFIGRHQAQVASTGSAGSLRIAIDLDQLPRPMGTTAVLGGETWYFQCWFREAGNSNFTDAISLAFQ